MKQQLQKRLTEEFVLRNTPLNTRVTYQRCIDRFERHFAQSAATLGRKQVRQFLMHLIEHEKLSPITHNVYAAALYFLYANVLGRSRVVEKLPRRKPTRKLPVVLTPAQVERLLGVLPPTHRAVLMLAYGAGLRISEACHLRIADVDSKAGVLHVHNAKCNRDRDVMLSPRLLAELRSYTARSTLHTSPRLLRVRPLHPSPSPKTNSLDSLPSFQSHPALCHQPLACSAPPTLRDTPLSRAVRILDSLAQFRNRLLLMRISSSYVIS
jgi:site-specific recombinase XerD